MAKTKTIVIFEAGPGTQRPLQEVLQEALPRQLNLEETEALLIPAEQWGGQEAVTPALVSDNDFQQMLVARQLSYMEARHWHLKDGEPARAYQDAVYSLALQSMYYVYTFGGTYVAEAERKADTLRLSLVPARKFRRPAWMVVLLGVLIMAIPLSLSLIFPNFLGAGWAILDLVAIVIGSAVIWRGGVRRLRLTPVTHKERCPGCGARNRFTNVVTLHCRRCGEELAYQFHGKDEYERALRVKAVKCPHCNALNDLRFQRLTYTCRRCEIRHTLGSATMDWLERLAKRG
jgi:hypothetical protein